jgi:hypothetical protein
VNDEISAELQGYMHEMEVELMTVRETYDEEIETLKKEKEELEVALHNWKGKAEEAIAIAERLNDEKEELQYMLSTQMQHQSASNLISSTNVFSAITEAADRNLGVIVKPKTIAPPAPGFMSSSSSSSAYEEDGNREWFEQSSAPHQQSGPGSQFQSNDVYGNDDFEDGDNAEDDDDDGDGDADTVTLKRDNRDRDSEIRSVNGMDDSDGDIHMAGKQGGEEDNDESPPDYEESLKEPAHPPPPPPQILEAAPSQKAAAAVAMLASELLAKNAADNIQLYIPPTRLSRSLMRGSGSSVNGSALSTSVSAAKANDAAPITAPLHAAATMSVEDASHSAESQSHGSSTTNVASSSTNATNTAASAFEMRMKRDQRFQKSEPPQSQQAAPATATATRSPLAPAKVNSPKVSLENSDKTDNAEKRPVLKRALSPMRTTGASVKATTIHADSKENLASSGRNPVSFSSQSQSQSQAAMHAAKSPARAASTKRVRSEENASTNAGSAAAAAPIVKMTAKARAQAADQKAKAKVSEVLTESGGIPPLNRRLLRAGVGRVV